MHRQGILYGDLKLENVLLCEGGRARLTDFGAVVAQQRDEPGAFRRCMYTGTPYYWPPEMGLGKAGPHLTATADMWCWGACMAELAVGCGVGYRTVSAPARNAAQQQQPQKQQPQQQRLAAPAGVPPQLWQLLVDHVMVADPSARWTARQAMAHPFFEGVDWAHLHLQPGPHHELLLRQQRQDEEEEENVGARPGGCCGLGPGPTPRFRSAIVGEDRPERASASSTATTATLSTRRQAWANA